MTMTVNQASAIRDRYLPYRFPSRVEGIVKDGDVFLVQFRDVHWKLETIATETMEEAETVAEAFQVCIDAAARYKKEKKSKPYRERMYDGK